MHAESMLAQMEDFERNAEERDWLETLCTQNSLDQVSWLEDLRIIRTHFRELLTYQQPSSTIGDGL